MIRTPVFIVLISVTLLSIAACGPDASPMPTLAPTLAPTPQAFVITAISLGEPIYSELHKQEKLFDQCDVDSTIEAQVQYGRIASTSNEDETLFGGSLVVEGSLPLTAKAAVEGEFRKRYSNLVSQEDSHSEGLLLQIPARVKQVYIVQWRDIKRTGELTYIESGQTETRSFVWTTGFELVESKGISLPCPTSIAMGTTGLDVAMSSPTATPEPPTPTSEPPTATPEPPTATPEPPTATPEPPTATPMPPTATRTATPTKTPIPNTSPGSVLSPGETWYQDGMTMMVYDFRLEEEYCTSNTSPGQYTWSAWEITIRNGTSQDLVVNLEESEWYLVDSAGVPHTLYGKGGFVIVNPAELTNCWPNMWYGTGKPEIQMLKAGETVRFSAHGLGEIGGSEWFEFGVRKAGRIEQAAWRFDIPR